MSADASCGGFTIDLAEMLRQVEEQILERGRSGQSIERLCQLRKILVARCGDQGKGRED